MRWIKQVLKYGLLTIILLLGILALVNWYVAEQRDVKLNEDKLSLEQKTLMQAVVCVKQRRGNDIWPGFADTPLPMISYNDSLEFLVQPHGLQNSWNKVDDTFFGESYYSRNLMQQQAFAVPVDTGWAGSLGTRTYMNREFLLGLRGELPPVVAQLFPYFMATISKDQYVTTVIHELFHAFEATKAEPRFHRADEMNALTSSYPADDKSFARAWDREGAMLYKGYNTNSRDSLRHYAQQFLKLREQRRAAMNLADTLVAYEQALEWLEGLAKYAEMRSYELAALCPKGTYSFEFEEGFPYWQNEIKRLRKLGDQHGDFRFYISGMAQAFMLDRLNPDWKSDTAMRRKPLEELLRESLNDTVAENRAALPDAF